MGAREMTIDQLASKVGMTVRNVRAYATRGLLPAPRLVGRKGFYGPEHESRLRLIRELIDRGYTLGAVEKALEESPEIPDSHALDLLGLLANPMGQRAEPELMSRATLAVLAGISDDDELRDWLVHQMVERGLVEAIDDAHLKVLEPTIVRCGAQALAIGLGPQTVLQLFDAIRTDTGDLAERFVSAARREVWQPFAERGMPDEEWEQLVANFEAIIPVAVQVVLAAFRTALTSNIETAMGEELSSMSPEMIERFLPLPDDD
ncbi:MerR family transcriptional regulator [Nocardioides daejeonensis]|uniref:MerR family transcriptional regulator n=1 Tax=Nocardioides daejeonensis TaxID=1046556 RepID=UPI000D742FD7|nr:MerR family transcriptional regulator [Nocardioides daejeonensis]